MIRCILTFYNAIKFFLFFGLFTFWRCQLLWQWPYTFRFDLVWIFNDGLLFDLLILYKVFLDYVFISSIIFVLDSQFFLLLFLLLLLFSLAAKVSFWVLAPWGYATLIRLVLTNLKLKFFLIYQFLLILWRKLSIDYCSFESIIHVHCLFAILKVLILTPRVEPL